MEKGRKEGNIKLLCLKKQEINYYYYFFLVQSDFTYPTFT